MSVRVRTAMLGLAAIACNGDIQAVSWAPLDIDQLEDDMASPTAPLNDAAIAELQATPEDEITVIRGLLQVGRLIVETSGEGDMETETRDLDVISPARRCTSASRVRVRRARRRIPSFASAR
jgi:hypothetical protein